MTIIASNDCLWVTRKESESEIEGLTIPDSAKKPLHKGDIISVGELVSDPNSRKYKVAVFNKSAGFEIEEEGVTYLILRQMDIVGYDCKIEE